MQANGLLNVIVSSLVERQAVEPEGALGCEVKTNWKYLLLFTKLWKSFTTVTVAPYVSHFRFSWHFCQFQFQSNKSCCFQITIPKTDFYLREELELFEYPSKSSSSSSPSSLWTLWLVNDGGSAGRSLLSLGRAQSCCWFIPTLSTLSTLPTLFTLSRTHCRWVFSSQYTGNVSYVFRALPVLRVFPTLSCIFT